VVNVVSDRQGIDKFIRAALDLLPQRQHLDDDVLVTPSGLGLGAQARHRSAYMRITSVLKVGVISVTWYVSSCRSQEGAGKCGGATVSELKRAEEERRGKERTMPH